MNDGLADNNINSIVQGPRGYLWLVMPSGLVRFDGVNFDPFPTKDFTGRTAFNIRLMSRSRNGVLWMAFDDGTIIGLNPDFSKISFEHGLLPRRAPLAVVNDENGAVWLGYQDAIYYVQNGQITKLTASDGASSGIVHSLVSDGMGNIWLSRGNEIYCFKNGKFHRVADMPGMQCMAATHTNAVWLVADAHLFCCDISGKIQDCGVFEKTSDARAVALLQDHCASVWIGTHGNGLFRYNRSRFERVKTSLSNIRCLAEDHEGNIWAGTGGGGLDRITPRGIRLVESDNGKISDQVESICQDSKNVFWGATESGKLVARISDGWQPVFTNASFAGNVTCVAADRSALWVGTRDGKVLRIASAHDTTWETYAAQAPIRGLLVTSNGDLLIVSLNALQVLHEGQIENIRLPRKVRHIYAITEDVSGNIWIGANNGILLRMNNKSIVNETSRLRVSVHSICSLYDTHDGIILIGSRGGGLMWFRGGHGGQIALSAAFANISISQIVEDRRGWLWFGSNHGVFRIRERKVEQAIKDPGVCLRPIIYGKNEGIGDLEAVSSIISPFVLSHAILSSDGRVWMLMQAGIVEADPNMLREQFQPPSVVLTRVILDGQTIASDGAVPGDRTVANLARNESLQLPPSYRHLEFDFTSFHFSAPENVHFRYRLADFDTNWIDAKGYRSASYSRLSAGNYRFCVEACIGDGPWSKTPTMLAFAVVPFFWQTWWFRSGALLLFTSTLIAIVRYISHRRLRLRLRGLEQMAAVERERTRIARDIHDDLGNRLTEIQLLSGLGQRNRKVSRNAIVRFHEISSAARHATDALDEIVWAVNPRNDTLPHLIDYIGQFTTEYMRAAGIRCRVGLPENPPSNSVSAEIRHNLFLAIKEALNNIARHAHATEVSLLILTANKSLSVVIEDNGCGFNGETKNNVANGLNNLRQRIADIGGQFQIESKPGAGTRVSFDGPWLAE